MNMKSGGGAFAPLPNRKIVVASASAGQVRVIDPSTLCSQRKLIVIHVMQPPHFDSSLDRQKILIPAISDDLSDGNAHAGVPGDCGIVRTSVH